MVINLLYETYSIVISLINMERKQTSIIDKKKCDHLMKWPFNILCHRLYRLFFFCILKYFGNSKKKLPHWAPFPINQERALINIRAFFIFKHRWMLLLHKVLPYLKSSKHWHDRPQYNHFKKQLARWVVSEVISDWIIRWSMIHRQ